MSPFALDVGQTQVVVQYSPAEIPLGMDDLTCQQGLLGLRVKYKVTPSGKALGYFLMQLVDKKKKIEAVPFIKEAQELSVKKRI